MGQFINREEYHVCRKVRFNTTKMSFISKLVDGFNVVPIKTPIKFSMETYKLVLKLTVESKVPK